VAVAFAAAVEALRVQEVQAVHSTRKRFERRLDDQMEVIVHQAPGVHRPVEPLLDLGQLAPEPHAVEIVQHDVHSRDAANDDVEDPVLGQDTARSTRHRPNVPPV